MSSIPTKQLTLQCIFGVCGAYCREYSFLPIAHFKDDKAHEVMRQQNPTASIPTKQIDGDVAVGRNVSAGGDANIQGNARIGHDLIVEGWLEVDKSSRRLSTCSLSTTIS